MSRRPIAIAVALLFVACTVRAADEPAKPSPKEPTTMPTKVTHTDDEWRKLLSPEQYRVLRQAGTERPFVGQYTDTTTPGTYSCAACDSVLFHSTTKFHSGCGWPSFYAAAAGDKVTLRSDNTHGMTRTEVLCATCGSHLGHLFDDAPDQPTGQRYCINSLSLKFTPDEKKTATQPGPK